MSEHIWKDCDCIHCKKELRLPKDLTTDNRAVPYTCPHCGKVNYILRYLTKGNK